MSERETNASEGEEYNGEKRSCRSARTIEKVFLTQIYRAKKITLLVLQPEEDENGRGEEKGREWRKRERSTPFLTFWPPTHRPKETSRDLDKKDRQCTTESGWLPRKCTTEPNSQASNHMHCSWRRTTYELLITNFEKQLLSSLFSTITWTSGNNGKTQKEMYGSSLTNVCCPPSPRRSWISG